jgi:Ca2+-binding EF-hand superfamily protein
MGEPFYGRTAGEDGLVVWFEQADSNHDGFITAQELAADAERFFQTLDRSHDGEIDPDDVSYYEEKIVPQLRLDPVTYTTSEAGGEVHEHVDDESSSGRFGLLQIPEPVTSADTNFNRGVSLQEFRAAATTRFQLLDIEHQGKLSLSQLQNIRSAARNVAAHRRNGGSSPSDNPTSAEYGRPPSQP